MGVTVGTFVVTGAIAAGADPLQHIPPLGTGIGPTGNDLSVAAAAAVKPDLFYNTVFNIDKYTP